MAEITASAWLQGAARKDRCTDDGVQKSAHRSGWRHEPALRKFCGSNLVTRPNKAAIACHRRGHRSAFTIRPMAAPASMVELNCETDFVCQKRRRSSPSARALASHWCPQKAPADVAALSALTYAQDGFDARQRRRACARRLIGKIGENMYRCAASCGYAGHGQGGRVISMAATRIGVLVDVPGRRRGARQGPRDARSRQSKPVALDSQPSVSAELIEKERSIASPKRPPRSGKPADIIAKMVEGTVARSS